MRERSARDSGNSAQFRSIVTVFPAVTQSGRSPQDVPDRYRPKRSSIVNRHSDSVKIVNHCLWVWSPCVLYCISFHTVKDTDSTRCLLYTVLLVAVKCPSWTVADSYVVKYRLFCTASSRIVLFITIEFSYQNFPVIIYWWVYLFVSLSLVEKLSMCREHTIRYTLANRFFIYQQLHE